MPVSVFILTLNEEANLRDCVASLSWSDDITVLDSGSTDRTREVAAELGCKVLTRPFDNWAAHQNWALTNIPFKHPWVYYSDADERVPPELRDELLAVADNPADPNVAYFLGPKNFFMGRWLKHCYAPVPILRFMRPGKVRYERLVNPTPVIDGPHGYLRGLFDHYNFSKGIGPWWEKHVKYADAEAKEGVKLPRPNLALLKELFVGDRATRRKALKRLSFALPMRPFLKFAYLFLLKGGWRDGSPGLTYCTMQSIYEYMIVLRMRELRLQARGRSV